MSTEITAPPLGESVTEATVARWTKKPGDTVKADEALARARHRQGQLSRSLRPQPACWPRSSAGGWRATVTARRACSAGSPPPAPPRPPRLQAPETAKAKPAAAAPAGEAPPVPQENKPAPAPGPGSDTAAHRANGRRAARCWRLRPSAWSPLKPASIPRWHPRHRQGRPRHQGRHARAIATGPAAAPAPAAPAGARALARRTTPRAKSA